MQPTDAKRFRDLLRGMGRLYGQEPDVLVLDAYWLALGDWSYEDFEAAARHLMANAKFMPRPAEFNELRKATEPDPYEAWEIAVQNCISWRTGKSDAGELIDSIVRSVGGYRSIAMADEDRVLPHIQRRFLEAFEHRRDSNRVREALPQLAAPSTKARLESFTDETELLTWEK